MSIWTRRLFPSEAGLSGRLRTLAWEDTALGSPEGWETALRTLVPIMLASNQPMFIAWGADRTLLYNDAYAEILGHKHPEALGRDILQVWHEIRPDLEPIVAAAYRGEPVQMDDIQLWMERRGFREETHFSFFYAPVRGECGAVAGFLCACTEITGQVLAERRLAESESRHRGVLTNMDEGFVLFDGDFRILEINQAATRLVGLPREELIGRDHWERFPGTLDSEVGRIYRRVLADGQPGSLEHLYQFEDGRSCWFELRAFAVGTGFAVLFRDVTERRQMMDALQQADRRKDEFLAMLAHELRNPLAPIRTAAHVLRRFGGASSPLDGASEVIERQVGHLTRLVDDLLDVSRVTRGQVTLRREPVDLQQAVAAAVEQTRGLVQSRGHRLRTSTDAGPLVVSGDHHRLVQVFSNLLSNAAKYTPHGGAIELRLGREDDHVWVRVTDDGIGISGELLPHVFELFTQGDRTPDRGQGGLGIGLALVRSMVELHGGQVHAASGGPGCGSEFTVRLPLLRAAEPPPQLASDTSPRPAIPRQVMIVDDNVDAAGMLATALRLAGHRVSTAADAGGALRLAAVPGARWDAFVLDIGLPDMTGYELAGKLRACDGAAASVFVALTGYGQEHDRESSRAAGFHHHLVKPADTDHLMRLIEVDDDGVAAVTGSDLG
jgi:PAS domain S-box-containing protein